MSSLKKVRVIGSSDNLFVTLGTKEEYLYWRVMEYVEGSLVGIGKKFYESPMYAPGYEEWSKSEKWQKNIKEWERRRNECLDFIVIE